MSEFSQTKNWTIDPIHNSNTRCEIRLPSNTVLLSKMSLMNVGVYGDATARNYIASMGVKALIKNIHLMDGNQKIDSVINFNKWSAYTEYNSDNDSERDMKNKMSGSGFGFVNRYKNEAAGTTKPFDANFIAKYNPATQTRLEEDNTFKGVIALRDVFSFLQNSLIVPTTLFKNLRLVIEWQTDMASVFITQPATKSFLVPYLVCKEVIDEGLAMEFVKKYNGVQYQPVELDVMNVPEATNADGSQETKKKVIGFNGKFVNNIVVQKERTDGGGLEDVKNFGSVAQDNEKFNIVLNGKKLLPFQGVDKVNKRLGMLHMVNGTHNTVRNFNCALISTSNVLVDSEVGRLVGNMDYLGLNIVDRVSDLQLEYKRDTHKDKPTFNQALKLNIYAKVNKAVVVSGNDYVVEYQ